MAEWNHLCTFGKWNHREHFCETILNLEQWFKIVLVKSSSGPRNQRRGIIYAIFVKGFRENINVKIF